MGSSVSYDMPDVNAFGTNFQLNVVRSGLFVQSPPLRRPIKTPAPEAALGDPGHQLIQQVEGRTPVKGTHVAARDHGGTEIGPLASAGRDDPPIFVDTRSFARDRLIADQSDKPGTGLCLA